ncbi:MAG: Crp/Fnr family transcriptional regulator [Pirellulales bacterium]|nr:Crp/Fnr family transcriptional regulator [Pirellulales bacterium]
MTTNLVDILQSCRLFSQVHARGFQRLVTMGRLVRFEKGEMIFRDGQDCPGVYVVGSGLVRIFKVGPGGKEHVLHIVGPGETFAEVAAVGGLACPANAEAIAPTECAMLPLEPFRRAMQEDHQFCLDMMAGLTVWVRHLVGLMEDLVLRDATGRLARYLLDADPGGEGLIELPTLKRHVASHLNLTSETLSRTIRRLHEAGLIAQPDNTRIQLVDREGLRRAAEGNVPKG